MSEILYCPIRTSEIEAVSSLAREVFEECVAPQFEPEGVAEFNRYACFEAVSRRQETDHVIFVAEHEGELAGMIQLRTGGHVAMLFVRSEYQCRGIGRGLLRAAGVLTDDPDRMFTVNSSPNAVAAYERMGFSTTGPEQCLRGIRFVPMQRRGSPRH